MYDSALAFLKKIPTLWSDEIYKTEKMMRVRQYLMSDGYQDGFIDICKQKVTKPCDPHIDAEETHIVASKM